jgi:chemotaxis response regulator CheB
MPEAAIDTGCIDFILPLEKIGDKLAEICSGQ